MNCKITDVFCKNFFYSFKGCCDKLFIQSSGATAAVQSALLGDYTYSEESNGKRAYRFHNNQGYLYWAPVVGTWRVCYIYYRGTYSTVFILLS